MSNIAIQVENVSKLYHIGETRTYKTARESVMNVLNTPARLAKRLISQPPTEPDATELWALKDVSFTVQQGDVVGIIGRNGAGKSTLLKVLSRITEPTSGRIKIRGRVGSLLEVGTGFHPELTGRENIFLNGAILGMRRWEILRKFDEIVAFSEVEKFIDTPVKHYSSGMYMRLAFAVAAHLEPEILIVDEVLAVGDAQFQKKCLGKMQDVAGAGRTVLFVSHNLTAVSTIARKAIVLHQGQIAAHDFVDAALRRYMELGMIPSSFYEQTDGWDANFSLVDDAGERLSTWNRGQTATLIIDIERDKPMNGALLDFAVYSETGTRLFSYQGDRSAQQIAQKSPNQLAAQFSIENPGLACYEVSFDFGIRTSGSPEHVKLWRGAVQTSVGLEDHLKHSHTDYVVSFPLQVTVP